MGGQFGSGFADDDPEESGAGNPGEGSQLLEFGSNQFGHHSRGGGPGGHIGRRTGDDNPKNAESGYKQVAAVISSSLAFLDAIIKKMSSHAFGWKIRPINGWIRPEY